MTAMISYHPPRPRRPLVICLHGIGSDENAKNINPLNQWGDFDADVYSVPWFKGEIGKGSFPGCVWHLGAKTRELEVKHNPSEIIYIGFSTGCLVGLRTMQHFRLNPHDKARAADKFIGFYGVYDLTRDEFMTEPVDVPELFNIFLTGSAAKPDRATQKRASAAYYDLDFPMKLFHGGADKVVSFNQSARIDPDFNMVNGQDHGFSPYQEEIFNKVKAFISAD